MPRVSVEQLKRRIKFLNGQGANIDCDKTVAGYRIQTADNQRYISPRLPLPQIMDWLEAFEMGWETHHALTRK